jgi:hypothetical protein
MKAKETLITHNNRSRAVGGVWHEIMARFLTLLLLSIAVHSPQAIDKYSFGGDVFKLGDLLAAEGDNRLKKALSEFRDNQAKARKAAGDLLSANDGVLKPIFSPRDSAVLNNQVLISGVARSEILIKAARDYQEALYEYKKLVNNTYKNLSPPQEMPGAMTKGFERCSDWVENSRDLAWNVRVYFDHLINRAIPVQPNEAKKLVELLANKVRINNDVVAEQKNFDREQDKLNLDVVELAKAKANHGEAKAANYKSITDLGSKNNNLALSKSAMMAEKNKLTSIGERFTVIRELVDLIEADKDARGALNKVVVAEVKASAAVATAKDASDKALAVFNAADKIAKDAEATLMRFVGDAYKEKKKKDAVDKVKAAKAAEIKAAVAEANATAALAVATAKLAAASAVKVVDKKAKAVEEAKNAKAVAKRKSDTASDELNTAWNAARNVTKLQVLQEEGIKRELGLLKEEKEKARLAFEDAVKKKNEADRLLVEAKNTVKNVKSMFEGAQRKLKNSTLKERGQRKVYYTVKMSLDEVKSKLNKVHEKIAQNRRIAWDNCVQARDRIIRGYVKRKPGLNNGPAHPFALD